MRRKDGARAHDWAVLAFCVAGALIWLVAIEEPRMIEDRIGPGFMAQVLAAGVIGISLLLWLKTILGWRDDRNREQARQGSGNAFAGPLLLASVLAFALLVPVLGLVLGAAVVAALGAVAAGDRQPLSIAGMAVALAALVAAIGWAALPASAPLWPRL
jgi:hypothetical protein